MIFLITSINNCPRPTIFIVLSVNQPPLTLKSLFSLSCALTSPTMPSKSIRIAKYKHGVRMRGLPKEVPASSTAPETPSPATSKKPLDVQPISKPIKPDFAKKQFKTGTSKRYRSSMSGISIPAAAPEPEIDEEDEVNVDEIIMKTTEDILNETADQVLKGVKNT